MTKQTRYFWRLSSLKQLVLLSFLVVVTPFGILIFYATDALVEQSAQGRVLAQQALEVTRRGQQLEQLAEDITRSARQYQVIPKLEIKQRLEQFITEFKQQLTVHSFILPEGNSRKGITSLLDSIEQVGAPEGNSLLAFTRALNQQIDLVLDRRLQSLNETAQLTQAQLSTFAILLLVIEAMLIMFFSLTITRPVKRLAARIRALGTGEDYTGSKVGGPDELIHLDQQLDWLTGRLAEVENEKQRFLRHMSHELKTPLTTLREGSDLLADQITGSLNESQMEIALLLQNNSRELQSLIEQLLDYSRLSQHEPVNKQTIQLQSVLTESIEPYKLLLEQKKINLQLSESNTSIYTDRAMLIRILSNLISNAALYGSETGTLKIDSHTTSNHIYIDVINDGPIIPKVDLPNLFEPFYQGTNRRKGPVKGSGIGLSIVRDAAESIGASVKLIKNINNRVGFRIHLPQHGENNHD
ncbi:MAG: sensor histidine kinase [Neptuniibacter sp.]